MTRKIGRQIMQACAIVESHSLCTSLTVTPLMQITSANAIRCLSRAVGHGLLAVDRTNRPHFYYALKDWRSTAAASGKPRGKYNKSVLAPVVPASNLQSVWRA